VKACFTGGLVTGKNIRNRVRNVFFMRIFTSVGPAASWVLALCNVTQDDLSSTDRIISYI